MTWESALESMGLDLPALAWLLRFLETKQTFLNHLVMLSKLDIKMLLSKLDMKTLLSKLDIKTLLSKLDIKMLLSKLDIKLLL